jgi:hypothetical protein
MDKPKTFHIETNKDPKNTQSPTDKVIASGWHHTFGWLRRPELDDAEQGLWAYESPDGDEVYSPNPRHKRVAYLDCWETEAGEKYLSFSPDPKTDI